MAPIGKSLRKFFLFVFISKTKGKNIRPAMAPRRKTNCKGLISRRTIRMNGKVRPQNKVVKTSAISAFVLIFRVILVYALDVRIMCR